VSRIGKLPVPVPAGVKTELKGTYLKLTGPKGSLEYDFRPEVNIAVEGEEIIVTRPNDQKEVRAFHALTRALIASMVEGVSKGFELALQIEGVGYRAAMQGKNLSLSVGHSHPVVLEPPAGITFVVEGTQVIKISGIDKQLVGQTAANVRRVRPPEPYKGKGIRLSTEVVRRKEGKSGGK
jgi:large subunit ribosomal protein L6